MEDDRTIFRNNYPDTVARVDQCCRELYPIAISTKYRVPIIKSIPIVKRTARKYGLNERLIMSILGYANNKEE